MLRTYLIGTVIVWVALIIASAAVLAGTKYLPTMLIILGGGAFWSIVLVPGGLLRRYE